MSNRKGIGKKLRFEIFKRDSFKCQYCGKSAPDVILEVDHIVPVSKGGDNDSSNLITSCRDCNRGKTNIELSDDSALAKQKQQLEELNERRIQLEMMIDWRQNLKKMDDDVIDVLAEEFEEATGYEVSENGKKSIKKWLKQYSYIELSEAIDKSVLSYEDASQAFSKIPSVAYWSKNPQDELMKELYYIRGIMRNRFNYVDDRLAIVALKNACQSSDDIDELREIALNASNWTSWKRMMEERGFSVEY